LPQGLKVFERPVGLSSALWNEVMGVDSIESLAFEWQSSHPSDSQLTAEAVTQISRLTKLKDLDFVSSLPQGVGIGTSLQALPMLRNLTVRYFRACDAEELKGLTQLVHLAVSFDDPQINLKHLRKQFPFMVYKL
jgi:hypothetical protein